MYILKKDIGRDLLIRQSDGASIPSDEGNSDYQTYLQWISEGNKPIIEGIAIIGLGLQVEAWINQQLDERARQVGYDNIIDACSFISSTNKEFKQDAKNLITLRDKAWEQYYNLKADAKAEKIKLDTVEDWRDSLTVLDIK